MGIFWGGEEAHKKKSHKISENRRGGWVFLAGAPRPRQMPFSVNFSTENSQSLDTGW